MSAEISILAQIKTALDARMAARPVIEINEKVKLPGRFPVTKETVGSRCGWRVGKSITVLPLSAEVRLPADYDGDVRIAVLPDRDLSVSFFPVNEALGLPVGGRTLHDVCLSVSAATDTAIIAAAGAEFMRLAIAGEIPKTSQSRTTRPRETTSPSAECIAAACELDAFEQAIPPIERFREYARLIGLMWPSRHPLRDAYRTLPLRDESLPFATGGGVALSDELILVLHPELPIAAFSEMEREGEWRASRPGIVKVVRKTNPVERMLDRSIEGIGLSEFTGTDCFVSWATAFHSVYVSYILESELRRSLDSAD